jgi:hypothetical protein
MWLDRVLDTWLSWGSHCGCSSSCSLLTHHGPNFRGGWSYNLEFLIIVIKYKMCCCKWWNFSKDFDNMRPIVQNMFPVVPLKPEFWQQKTSLITWLGQGLVAVRGSHVTQIFLSLPCWFGNNVSNDVKCPNIGNNNQPHLLPGSQGYSGKPCSQMWSLRKATAPLPFDTQVYWECLSVHFLLS